MGNNNIDISVLEGIYALANPNSGITALNMNCECNLFGRKTYFNMTSLKTFDIIDDAPVEKEVEKEEGSWWGNLITGIIATAALAACAIAVVATGGAALGAIMLAGAAIGTGIVTVSAAITDAKSGQARSWTQFLGDLVTGGITGAVAGATIYGLWTAAPIVGQAFGIQASMLFGGVTKFTAITIPKIFAGFGKFLIGTQGVRYLNEITSIGSGQNWLLDHMFSGNQENYTTAGICLDLLSMGYVQIASDNAGLVKDKDSKDSKNNKGSKNSETNVKQKNKEIDNGELENKSNYKEDWEAEIPRTGDEWEENFKKRYGENAVYRKDYNYGEIKSKYSGKLIKVSSPDPSADKLAQRIGGDSRVKFEFDPDGREFDAISSQYIAQAKPALSSANPAVKAQMKATFEAAIANNKIPYFQFEGQPNQSVIDKILEYSKRYGI